MTRIIAILAGGEGRRIGGAKPMRLLAGRTLMARAIDYAHAHAPIVTVCVRDPGQIGAIPVPLIFDDAALEGPLGGLSSALAFGEREKEARVLTIPCDSPFLPPDLLDRLDNALAPETGVAVASSGGRLHPVCALWRTNLRPQLDAYAAQDGSSLQGFASYVGYVAVEWPDRPVDPFFNINEASDLRHAEAFLSA